MDSATPQDDSTETDTKEADTKEAEGRNEKRQQDIERRTNPQALILHEAIRQEGDDELERPVTSLLWSGLAAGLSMGFSLAGEGLLKVHLPQAEWTPLISSLGYTFGFLIVILGRQQLFTENTLTVILPLLSRPSAAILGRVARLWAVVFAANIVGTIIFAALAALTEIFTAEARDAFAEIGRQAVGHGAWTTLLRGIFAGWVIALLVWITPAVGSARFLVIVALSYLISLAKFSHVIAGSVDAAYTVLRGDIGWSDYALGFLLPTLAGNVIGGVGLVALINHAQVRHET
jgi:formate/nitrite transporter FocA (FNT family)